MADASWEASGEGDARSGRALVVSLAVLLGLIVLAVAIWARFLTGVTAAPVPAGPAGGVPALTPQGDVGAAAGGAATAQPQGGATSQATATAQPDASPQASATPQAIPTVPALPQGVPSSVEPVVSQLWLDKTAAATGIPRRALQAYAGADLELIREQPGCGLGWNTLAGIGLIESGHGRQLTPAGYSTSPIYGPVVAGGIRAEGPMQFIPSTWKRWGADGNGDGVADPQQIDDAALAAGRYLCSYGSLDTTAGWRAAVFGYNHLDSYVNSVASAASRYARLARS